MRCSWKWLTMPTLMALKLPLKMWKLSRGGWIIQGGAYAEPVTRHPPVISLHKFVTAQDWRSANVEPVWTGGSTFSAQNASNNRWMKFKWKWNDLSRDDGEQCRVMLKGSCFPSHCFKKLFLIYIHPHKLKAEGKVTKKLEPNSKPFCSRRLKVLAHQEEIL